jgi:transcriptional regulator with GAF, ATPase, and Fis domain
MARIAAWLQACGRDDFVHADIRAKLNAAGIDLSPFQEFVSNPPFGIICFDQITDELFSLLGCRRSDLCRILAVSTSAPENELPVWRLLDAGASDVLAWDKEGVVAAQICAKLQRWSAVDDMIGEASSRGSFVGQSRIWRELVRKIVEAARFTRAPILLTGESGTGKELLARLISVLTPAADDQGEVRQELVTVDCGALTPELSGSEFFGHERGSFTGAHTMREGAFALADGATLLLDEIGEIPLTLQPQILRSIQEKTYKRLGSNVWQKSDFRLVSATNRDLEGMANRGNFRLDLYYRIAGCVFSSPPLRDRRDDILPLAAHFLSEILPAPVPEFDSHLREYLLNRAYPGNVRELRRLIQRIAIRYPGTGPVTAGDLPEEDRPTRHEPSRIWPDDRFERTISDAITLGISLKEISQTTVRTAIRAAVNSENGNLRRAAARLGITDRAIQMRRAAGQLGHQPSPRVSLSAKFDRMPAGQPRGDRPHFVPHSEVFRSNQ